MENKLEQLLNSLIDMGWRPFGKVGRWYISRDTTIKSKAPFFDFDNHNMSVSTRELLSKESWLWQFVCENNLNYSEDDSIYNVWLKHYADDDHESPYTYASPVWYLIESSLKDESELEDFLLQNIKLWNEQL